MLTLGLLATSSTAMAADYEPFMWGVGGKLGTIVVPGQYPARFPDIITNYNFLDEGPRAGRDNGDDPNRDLDQNGDPVFTSLRRVKGDFRIAADGFLAIDGSNRIGATLGLNTGKGMSDYYFTANYDNVLVKSNPFNVVVGASAGFGQMTFKGVDDEETPRYANGYAPENEILKIPNFPVRGHVEGQFHTDTMMYGVGIFAGTAIPSNMYYTDLQGNVQDAVGGPGNFLYLVNAGLELTVRYGDFTPPKKNKPPKNKGGNKGGGNKGGGNKGGGNKGGGKGGGNSGSRGGR
jgi:hypothetical protein